MKTTAAANHVALFAEGDRADFPGGSVICRVIPWVVRAKGLLERLIAAGRMDGVRTVRSPDYDALETWPDEDLEAVGTRRTDRREYEYEVK